MNDKEFDELRQKISEGLNLSRKQMLHEKALHDECIVVYDKEADAVVRIPAREVLEKHPELRL